MKLFIYNSESKELRIGNCLELFWRPGSIIRLDEWVRPQLTRCGNDPDGNSCYLFDCAWFGILDNFTNYQSYWNGNLC